MSMKWAHLLNIGTMGMCCPSSPFLDSRVSAFSCVGHRTLMRKATMLDSTLARVIQLWLGIKEARMEPSSYSPLYDQSGIHFELNLYPKLSWVEHGQGLPSW
jgi:hypothetical protein